MAEYFSSLNTPSTDIVEVSPPSETTESAAAVESPNPQESATIKTEKKQRKPRDPNAPKPPTQPFLRFMAQNRQGVKDSHPDASFGQLTQELAAKWRSMSDEEKKPYVEPYESERKVYQELMKAYKANLKKNGGVFHEEEEHDAVMDVDETALSTAPSTPVQTQKASKLTEVETPPTSPAPVETIESSAQEDGQKKKKKHKTKKREGEESSTGGAEESSKKKKKKVKHTSTAVSA